MNKYLLKLYIAGHNPRSERAIVNLKQICEAELAGDYQMVIIDVLETPQAAEQERILATPTLVREMPPPSRRLIGDLSDRELVLSALDLAGQPRRANGR
jgi:circadian clock protein KaiB